MNEDDKIEQVFEDVDKSQIKQKVSDFLDEVLEGTEPSNVQAKINIIKDEDKKISLEMYIFKGAAFSLLLVATYHWLF